MASQPIIPFSELVYRQPKPKVSFAVIAGEGAQAVDTAVKALPAATQNATLDDLAWRDMTEHLIATAEKLLSPRMYAAFLRWGEAASHFSTRYETDEEGNSRCDANSDAVRALAATSSLNAHDFALKSFVSHLEHGDCGAFGHLSEIAFEDNYLTTQLAWGVVADLTWQSPVVRELDQLASKARRLSAPELLAIDPVIGSEITRAFSFARGANSVSQHLSANRVHTSWLRERNALIERLNDEYVDSDDDNEQTSELRLLSQLDKRILNTPANDKDALFTQLVLAAQIVAEGHVPDEEVGRTLVRRSIALCGEGYLWSAGASEHVA